jgi:hypothetical protein
MAPQRRQHARGAEVPAGVIDVGPGTVWADALSRAKDPQRAIAWYRTWLISHPVGQELAARARIKLRGKDLSCTCALDQPCHADVLLDIVNTSDE